MKPKILIPFYSMYGHIYKMALAVKKGVETAGGEPRLVQVAELVPEDRWDEHMKKAKEMMKDVPLGNPREDLKDVDGVIVGTPTRFGNMSAQMRNYWDQTGGDWAKGTLIGKPAGVFTGSANQHGGQESTILTSLTTFLHHGMVFVGLPYSFTEQTTMEEIAGGSPYGSSTVVGSGEKMPSALELKMAQDQGEHLTKIATKLMK